MEVQSIRDFVDGIREHLDIDDENEVSADDLEAHMYKSDACLFTWDLKEGEMHFRSGFKALLGYDDEEVNLDRFVSFFHPDEETYIRRIGQAATLHSVAQPQGNKKWVLYVAHRIRRADDRYMHVLAQSTPFALDSKGMITKFLVKLTDIDFKESNGAVHYKFIHPGLDADEFHRSIYPETYQLFTDREVQIIRLLNRKLTSTEIAKNLGISKHTVSTHRKNILKKTGCHSVVELLGYCERNGFVLD